MVHRMPLKNISEQSYKVKITTFGTSLVFHGVDMGRDVRKPVFGGSRTTQAQTSLRIRAV